MPRMHTVTLYIGYIMRSAGLEEIEIEIYIFEKNIKTSDVLMAGGKDRTVTVGVLLSM